MYTPYCVILTKNSKLKTQNSNPSYWAFMRKLPHDHPALYIAHHRPTQPRQPVQPPARILGGHMRLIPEDVVEINAVVAAEHLLPGRQVILAGGEAPVAPAGPPAHIHLPGQASRHRLPIMPGQRHGERL